MEDNKQNNQGKNIPFESKKQSNNREKELQLIFDGLDQMTGKRDKVVTVRLTEKEHAILKAKAKLSGSTITDFIVNAIEDVKVAGFSEIKKQIEDIYK